MELNSLLMYSLYAPTWTARKFDKKSTQKVKEANGVNDDVDAGNFNKLVLPDCDELKAISKHIGKTRNSFYLRTAPWGETRGIRVGKAENHMDLMVWFGDQRAEMQPLLRAFEVAYPQKVAEAEYLLHGMFDINDYPPWEVVERKFDLRLSTTPLPNVEDVRVLTEIPEDARAQIEQEILQSAQEAQTIAVREAFGTMLKPVAHMAAQLKEYDEGRARGERKKIYDSLVENVLRMSEAARRLNITRDPQLESLADEAVKMVVDIKADDLKDSDGLRVQKRIEAQKLAARIAKFLP